MTTFPQHDCKSDLSTFGFSTDTRKVKKRSRSKCNNNNNYTCVRPCAAGSCASKNRASTTYLIVLVAAASAVLSPTTTTTLAFCGTDSITAVSLFSRHRRWATTLSPQRSRQWTELYVQSRRTFQRDWGTRSGIGGGDGDGGERVPSKTTTTLLYAATTPSNIDDDVVAAVTSQPLTPRSSVSKERRDAALQALRSANVDAALQGVDAQLLELLSEEFLYHPGSASSTTRSKDHIHQPLLRNRSSNNQRRLGRPELVPGAMTRANMIRYKNNRDLLNGLVTKVSSTTPNTVGSAMEDGSTLSDIPTVTKSPPSIDQDFLSLNLNTPSIEVEQRKCRNSQKGNTDAKSKEETTERTELPNAGVILSSEGESSNLNKKGSRRRMKKNLPKSKTVQEIRDDWIEVSSPSSPYSAINNLELRKYYTTALLTPEEEFKLGFQVQLMIQCEEVHEGLAMREMRLPTIEEWATACGFTEEEPDFSVCTKIEKQLRPVGAEIMFEKTNPFLFVGNGLAYTIGVGRGRGREKKPPPTSLKDVFELKSETGKKSSKIPINRGTPTDFMNLIMEGRNAKQLMVQANMRLVLSIARKYTKTGVGLQDLVQEGSLGLSRAADKYDPTKGFKFSTYASWYVNNFPSSFCSSCMLKSQS
jgi:hypothetical protein